MDWSLCKPVINNSRQIPKILRHQLLCTLTEQYIAEKVKGADPSTLPSAELRSQTEPSILRFYGSLLFVDISGFTALSLKLDVETLKNRINEYFSKMLDIVDKWGGDVIKFAGDALYIVWRVEYSHRKTGSIMGSLSHAVSNSTAASLIHNPEFLQSARLSIEKAVACGLEITASCSNHKVMIPLQRPQTASRWSMLLSSIPLVSPSKVTPEAQNEVCLNVHSGIGFGLLGGIDIGAHNRWEYFLVGDPITQVAEAESVAGKGDVVLSVAAHDLLHPREAGSDDEPCKCTRLDHGLCKISSSYTQSTIKPSMVRRRSKAKLSIDDQATAATTPSSLNSISQDITDRSTDDLIEDLEIIYSVAQNAFKHRLLQFLYFKRVNLAKLLGMGDDQQLLVSRIDELPDRHIDRFCTDFLGEKIRPAFQMWLQQCMLDDVLRHNHEAARVRQEFAENVRSGALYDLFQVELPSSTPSPMPLIRQSTDSFRNLFKLGSRTDFNRSSTELSKSRRQNSKLRGQSFNLGSPAGKLGMSSLLDEASMSPEIRTVAVMFIKIDGLAADIFVDNEAALLSKLKSKSKSRDDNGGGRVALNEWTMTMEQMAESQVVLDKFNFLRRTAEEKAHDQDLLNRLQACVTVLNTSFLEHGGQVRQFIVDDKGTVCIGTFGLRGSTADDNAASAVEAAKNIVINLHNQGLVASIGITSGRAYCGWVGSPQRHEYAVMGPSTNLSARLMCKAPPYTIICDQDTKAKDRSHVFEMVGEVTAKGYDKMVKIFKPVFEDLIGASDLNEAYAALSPGSQTKSRIQGLLRSSLDSLNLTNLLATAKLHDFTARGPPENSASSPAAMQSRREKPRNRDVNSTIGILVASDFFFHRRHGKNSSLESPSVDLDASRRQQVRLHGREEDLNTILKFLFLGVVKNVVHRKMPSKEALVHLWETLQHQNRSRLVVITGKEGVGKSTLIQAVTRKFLGMQKKYPKVNYFVFKNRVMTLAEQGSLQPFLPWKTIFQDVLRAAYYQRLVEAIDSSQLMATGSQSSEKAVMAGLQSLLPAVPEELHCLVPLLGWIGIIPSEKDNEVTAKLVGGNRAAKCLDILVFLLQAYTNITGNVAFIIIEKLQLFDSWSLTLLQRAWANTCGCVFLASYSPLQTVSASDLASYSFDVQSPSGATASLGSPEAVADPNSLFSRFVDRERFLLFSLPVLPKDAVMRMCREVAKEHHQTVADETFERICTISGGNGLYAFEIIHALCSSGNSHRDLESLLAGTSSRIEEVICFRFDQIEPLGQLILKHAAVVTANGGTLDFAMLKYLLVDNKHHRPLGESDGKTALPDPSLLIESSILAALQRLIEDEDFLRFEDPIDLSSGDAILEEDANAVLLEETGHASPLSIDVPPSSNPPVSTHADRLRALIATRKITFRVVIERLTIYNLLMEEQKEALHDLVATFLHKANQRRRVLSMPSGPAAGGSGGGGGADLLPTATSLSVKIASSPVPSPQRDARGVSSGGRPEFYAPSLDNAASIDVHASTQALLSLRPLTVRDVLEEAFHWEQAFVFNYALQAYYHAACLCLEAADLVGQRQHLQSALRIFCMMKQDVGLGSGGSLTLMRLRHLIEEPLDAIDLQGVAPNVPNPVAIPRGRQSSAASRAVGPLPVAAASHSREGLSAVLIEDMCYSDRDVVETVVRLLSDLAQSLQRRLDHPLLALQLTAEGVEILQLVRAPRDPSTVISAPLGSPIGSAARAMGRLRHSSSAKDTDGVTASVEPPEGMQLLPRDFYLTRYEEVRFPLFAGFALSHLLSLHKEVPEKVEMAQLIVRHLLAEAPRGSLHAVHAQALMVLVWLRRGPGHLKDLRHALEEVLAVYDAAAWSPQLVALYGADIVVYAVAVGAQQLFVAGETRFVEREVLPRLLQDLFAQTDAHSITLSCLPLIALLNAFRRFGEAAQVVTHLEETEAGQGDGSEGTFLSESYTSRLQAVAVLKDSLFPSVSTGDSGSNRSVRSNVSAKLRVSGTLRPDHIFALDLFADGSSVPVEDPQAVAAAAATTRPDRSTAEAFLFFSGLSETALCAESVLVRAFHHRSAPRRSANPNSSEASKASQAGIEEEAFPWEKVSPFLQKLHRRSSYYGLAAVNLFQPLALLLAMLSQSDAALPEALAPVWIDAARQYLAADAPIVAAVLVEVVRCGAVDDIALAVAPVRDAVIQALGPERTAQVATLLGAALSSGATGDRRRSSFSLPAGPSPST